MYYGSKIFLTLKAPDTIIVELANTADPDETAHNEPSHRDLQCFFFNIIQLILTVFRHLADIILSSAFLALFGLIN